MVRSPRAQPQLRLRHTDLRGDGLCQHALFAYKITGKERDAESGLDHFQFRNYGSSMGRWMIRDPAGMMAVDIDSPQTLNRYAYVLNNSLSLVDPCSK